MKKIRVWMAVILAAVFCIYAAAGSGEAELTYGVALETNAGYKADLYPYVVHGETADWYLAKADIEALGLEAMCEGLAQTMENMEADLAISTSSSALNTFVPWPTGSKASFSTR